MSESKENTVVDDSTIMPNNNANPIDENDDVINKSSSYLSTTNPEKSSFSIDNNNKSDNDIVVVNNSTKVIPSNKSLPFVLTDMKLGTSLLFFASLWYLINTGITATYRFSTLIQSQAKITQITIDFITSIFNLIAVMLLMHLSWFDGWKTIYTQLENFDPSKEWFWTRYFCGNKLLIAMWLIWLPNIICFFFAAWALYEFNTSGIPVSVYNYSSTIVAEVAGSFATCWLSFFWVYSTFPELMRKNNTYGSVTFGYYFTFIGAIYLGVSGWGYSNQNQFEPPPEFRTEKKTKNDGNDVSVENVGNQGKTSTDDDDAQSSQPQQQQQEEETNNNNNTKNCLQTLASDCLNPCEATGKYFQRPLFGSDFSTGTFIFFLASFVGILLSAIEYTNYEPSYQYGIGLTVTAIYFVGAIFLFVGSYPSHMRRNDHVGSTVTLDFFLWLFRGCRSQPKYEIITPIAAGGDENAKF